MIVRVIGDVHCKIDRYLGVLDDLHGVYGGQDVGSVQIGDMGFEEGYKKRLRLMKDAGYDPHRHVFFGGNHDDYDTIGEAFALGDFGDIPFVPNSFFIRGARSVDEDQRLHGHDHWDDEELSWKRSNETVNEYIKTEPRYVFSHDCPGSVASRMFDFGKKINSHTSSLLDELFSQHKPQRWFFGHWHEDVMETVSGTKFRCLGELSYFDLET